MYIGKRTSLGSLIWKTLHKVYYIYTIYKIMAFMIVEHVYVYMKIIYLSK